ncbi:hypothetical protein VZT92_017827 [Zoarces viviparus]|uniref:Uncharacterized protein n=1 Tax=Zoarces viviparus TaxID=48416 RepID=A0AAW1ENY7_ZOAVI
MDDENPIQDQGGHRQLNRDHRQRDSLTWLGCQSKSSSLRKSDKPFNTIGSLLVHFKDRAPPERMIGVICGITCDNCWD